MREIERAIDFWKQVDIGGVDKRHPSDRFPPACRNVLITSFDEYIDRMYFSESSEIHTGLIPKPYLGDISKAKIVFLLLNPGLSPNDYFDEEDEAYRKAIADCLWQDKANEDYFYPLDPKFCWTDSGRWWHKKLNPVIKKIMARDSSSYRAAAQVLGSRVAAVELFPYHSKTFGMGDAQLNGFESVQMAKGIAQEMSRDPDRLLVCMRRTRYWGIDSENCLNYKDTEARSAHITEDYARAILEYC